MKKQLKLTLLSCLLSIPAITQAGPKDDIYRKGWIDFNKNGKMDIYEDPSAPIEERVKDLLSQMNMDEKTSDGNSLRFRSCSSRRITN